HRLLLALVAIATDPDAEPGSRRRCLQLLAVLFSSDTAELEVIPWKLVRYAAVAVERWLCEELRPSDDRLVDWGDAFILLWILVQCCFAPVSSWERSQEEVETLIACIFRMGVLRKELLLAITRGQLRISLISMSDMVSSLSLILPYLCESAYARSQAPGDLLEAVTEVVGFVKSEVA
ncbi:hypothetical protein BD309DRAFT_830200, partial [Dichomitus squalens]